MTALSGLLGLLFGGALLATACDSTSSNPRNQVDGQADPDAAVGDAPSADLAVDARSPSPGDGSASGPGLWDPGFRQAIARSELGDISTITIGPCRYPGPCPPGVTCSRCPTGPSSYQQSNFFSTEHPPPANGYWVIDHNNDTGPLMLSYDNTCNSGPPNQSLPIHSSADGKGVFQLDFHSSPRGQRAYLRLDNSNSPCAGGFPYLGIGIHKDRGNWGRSVASFVRESRAPGHFSGDNTTVAFRAAISSCSPGAPCLFYFNIHTRWAGSTRLLVLTFGHLNHPGEHDRHLHWNWPAIESYIHDGHDIAYFRCDLMDTGCLTLDADGRPFQFSMPRLLAVASDRGLYDEPMPIGERIFIDGISWSVETAGPASRLSAWVEGMTVKPAQPPVAVFLSKHYDGESRVVELTPAETLFGKVTNLGEHNAQSCMEVSGRPPDQLNGEGWCRDLDHWTHMVSSDEAGHWKYADGVWRLQMSPVGEFFPPGSYSGFWRNGQTGEMASAAFSVTTLR